MFIYGKNPIKDLFDKDFKLIKKIWIDKKRHQSFFNDLKNKGIEINDFKVFNFRKNGFSSHENFQGIIALIEEPKIYSLKELIELNIGKESPKFLILDQIEDPQNFGAILRNAAAFDIDGVIYPSRNSAKLNSTVMKASAGNWMRVNLCETNSLNQVVDTLKKNYYWIISTSLEGKTSFEEIKNINQPKAIILGNEGKGVRKTLNEKSDFKIKINMNQEVESLNVASASAIILHYLF
ncbi:MAG: 23S rRNA (guanosine(2251)-2'-O)-methyltransferase RlmB [Candidatus Tyloplasma litorale]|nr:MAG: 23S rRNA (guanosine(2251)-2'-O)-methyltransferase RlmB [Mycoplasmatales bacterium]